MSGETTTQTSAADTSHEVLDPELVIVDADGHAQPVDPHATIDAHATTESDGGGHSTVFPPFDPSTFASQLLWLSISFAVLYVLMSKIALPRIGEILEVRRDRIEGDLADAERMRLKTDQAIASYEEALAAAKAKSQGIAEITRTEIKADIDAKRVKVESDLARKVAAAEDRIQATKAKALESVNEIAADTAAALAGHLIGKVSAKAARDAVAEVVKG